MRIVVLDGFAMNPGDLSWDKLEKLGEVTVYDRTPAELVVQRARGVDAVMVNKVAIDASVIEALPGLKYIGILATGFNIVDVAEARRRGIIVSNVPAYSTASVAQTAFALLLELTHHVGVHDRGVHAGKWSASPDFSYSETTLVELDGLTMGIVGWGTIGGAVGRIAQAFGMRVAAHSRTARDVAGVKFVDIETLFRESDVISLHCPLNEQTRGLVNAERLGWMKKSAFVINTSRGALIDERALAAALNEGRIAGAGVDVLSVEPPPVDNPLLSARNCVITPHIAWVTRAARVRLMNEAVENLRAFAAGQPRNVVQ